MKHYGDVNKINGAEVEPVDIITFGSPCQDLSVAGKRAGIQEGERSNLFFEAIRIIKEMREATNDEYPRYAVWENVQGAFSSNKGHDFHAVLEAFCSVCDDTISIPKPYDKKRTDKLLWNKAGEIVGDNYSIAWRTLDAQYWGVPQRRKRIYLVADFTGRCAGEILFKPESLRGDLQTSDETGQEVTADAVGSADGSYGISVNEDNCLTPYDVQSRRCFSADGVWPALYGGEGGGHGYVLADAVGGVDGSAGAAGVVSKGNGECFIMPERHMSLSIGGGQAGQGYPCTVYSFDSLSSNSMKSSNPFSGCRAVEVAKCIDTSSGDPSKNQGGVAVVECIGFDMYNQSSTGDKTRTLKTPAGGDDLPVVCVLNDQGGSSINVESEETSPTLRANSHQHEPVIAFAQNQREEVRDLGDKAGALAAEAGVHQQTYVAQPVIALQAKQQSLVTTEECSNTLGANDWKEPQVIALQANGIDRAAGFCQGASPAAQTIGYQEEVSPTIKGAPSGTAQVPAVCFDRATFNQGINAQYDFEVSEEGVVSTVVARGPSGVCYDARGNGDGETVLFEPRSPDGEPRIYDDICPTLNTAQGGQRQPCIVENSNPPRKYIIRRLTPTECARLQGFPDEWSSLAPYNPADAEFWEDVRKTHAEINGKKYKPVKDIKKWYEKLHTDSAEYKMWGNGIALPNAEYVLRGIAEHGAKTLGSLFDGSGGFPLAGVLNGIKPIWASEVEPYPIAVTKSRFKEVNDG